ncbi:MAG: SH3 domain-containing protein [Anaerolineae bacterium]|nr:SH3 domain-containing protein [Anaerolineae bacterium]
MKKTICILVLLLTLVIVPAPRANAQFCEGTLYSNLIPGDTAVVVPDNLLNVRSEPSLDGERIAQLEPYTELFVISGPVCAGGHAWYEVRLDAGQTGDDQVGDAQTGWVAEAGSDEYWLGKLSRHYITYEQLADPNGTTPTIRFSYPEASIERMDFDVAGMHGVIYPGTQIILWPLGGGVIFITAIPFEMFEATPDGGAERAEILRRLMAGEGDVALDVAAAYPGEQGQPATMTLLRNFQSFQNGKGFSYIAGYIDQAEFQPINRDSFWYSFHGMTNDGAYFVNVTMPLQPPQLPDSPPYDPDDISAYLDGYAGWMAEVEAFLMTQEGASYSPWLNVIEGIVYSLEIG